MGERKSARPYCSDEALLDEITLSLRRLRVLHSEEPHDCCKVARFVPLIHPVGTRRYVHARPCVLEPEITPIVDLLPTSR